MNYSKREDDPSAQVQADGLVQASGRPFAWEKKKTILGYWSGQTGKELATEDRSLDKVKNNLGTHELSS